MNKFLEEVFTVHYKKEVYYKTEIKVTSVTTLFDSYFLLQVSKAIL